MVKALAQNGALDDAAISQFDEKGLTIRERLLDGKPVPAPMKAGSILMQNKLTQHASLKNVGEGACWSFDLRYQPIGQPTGREEFPGFIERYRRSPQSALRDFREWKPLWLDARDLLASLRTRQLKHRWPEDSPNCA